MRLCIDYRELNLVTVKNKTVDCMPSSVNASYSFDRVAFLSQIISRDGVEVDPSKVEVVRDWPVPKSVTEIRSFLGLAWYYRKFIHGLSSIVVPMTALTKKNAKFIWDLSVRRTEIKRFELLVYARGDAPSLSTLTVQSTLRDRIQAGQTFDKQLQKCRQRDESKGLRTVDCMPSSVNASYSFDRVAFLSQIISRDGVEVDPSKVEVVRDWPVPKSVTEIRSFLGLAWYYRKFIHGLSSIVVPMTALTKKNAKFIWDLSVRRVWTG
ncbi:uncharacterized protein [Primulina huaijiensis]|uniref:uncharacterized protein n=1 Tax=Primulina huaijiensis TaxID=1492673 RepID=UPI003CC779FD